MDLEGRPPILRKLLAFPGIDPTLKDNYGTTPIMAVLTHGNVVQQLETLLESDKVDLDSEGVGIEEWAR